MALWRDCEVVRNERSDGCRAHRSTVGARVPRAACSDVHVVVSGRCRVCFRVCAREGGYSMLENGRAPSVVGSIILADRVLSSTHEL